MGNTDFVYLFTSAKGRIGRQQWWLGISILISIWVASFYLLETGSSLFPAITIIVWIAGIMVHIKRLHDRNKSGWWCLLLHTPVLNVIWAIIELGMLRGSLGRNRYGADPLWPQ